MKRKEAFLIEATRSLPISLLIYAERKRKEPLKGWMEWKGKEPVRVDWELKDGVLGLSTFTGRGVFHQDIQVKKIGPKKRPFWICPGCGKPRVILYFPPGSSAFMCRKCHGLVSYVKTMNLEEQKEYWTFRFFQMVDEYLTAETPEEQRRRYRQFLRVATQAFKYEILLNLLSDIGAMARFVSEIWAKIVERSLDQ